VKIKRKRKKKAASKPLIKEKVKIISERRNIYISNQQ